LAVIWLAFILSQGDHRKSTVQAWVAQHKTALEHLLKIQISDTDFTDDRLGLFLTSLSKSAVWEKIEDESWNVSLRVITPNNGLRAVRVDATTISGYHHIVEEGLMQLGNSKIHRPDLPQIKIMSAAHQPSGRMIATDTHPGNSADDPLYTPLIKRVKAILKLDEVLYLGDCKMAALETRAHIANQQDYYMTPLPMTGVTKDLLKDMVDYALQHPGKVEALKIGDENGLGFEHIRPLKATVDGKVVEWNERLFLVQFSDLLQRQQHDLEKRLVTTRKALLALTPQPGKGKRVFRSQEELQARITEILDKQEVAGLLDVKIECRETKTTKFIGRGRGNASTPTQEIVDTRYFVGTVERVKAAIKSREERLGWRLFATNIPSERLSMTQAIIEYRKGWGLERNFHILKDQPLGISPLFVHNDDQISGLTRLLLLGNRVLSEIELRVRSALKASQETLVGLYAGLPKKETATPTATKLLLKVVEAKISLVTMRTQEATSCHLTNLPPFLEKIMGFLRLNLDLYTSLQENENASKNSREK
jgi:transposase